MPRTVAIIQARTGSTRLPRKSIAPVLERPLLDLMLERVQRARTLDGIVLATTTAGRDDEIAAIGRSRGVVVFRGSEDDVLGRYVGAAAMAMAEVVVRLTADCPLLDPAVIDRVVMAHRAREPPADLVTNAPPFGRTYPDGMDVEVFTSEALVRAGAMACDAGDREHVTRRFHRAPFQVGVVDLDPPAGDVRITVDYAEDLELVRAIFEDLHPRGSTFSLGDVLAWLESRR
jgi:spore coat polysaccharide biosynthesis protein SpsF